MQTTVIGSTAREPRPWNPIILTNAEVEALFLSVRSNLPKQIEALYIDLHVVFKDTPEFPFSPALPNRVTALFWRM
jgi:hypothetical protein